MKCHQLIFNLIQYAKRIKLFPVHLMNVLLNLRSNIVYISGSSDFFFFSLYRNILFSMLFNRGPYVKLNSFCSILFTVESCWTTPVEYCSKSFSWLSSSVFNTLVPLWGPFLFGPVHFQNKQKLFYPPTNNRLI